MAPFKRLALEWVQTYEDQMYPASTVNAYRRTILRVYQSAMDLGLPKNPKLWQPAHFRAYWDSIIDLAPKTQIQYLLVLKLFLVWCGNQPFASIRLRIHPERQNVNWCTTQEVGALIAAAERPQLRAMVVGPAFTGCRVGELVGLWMKDVTVNSLFFRGKGGKGRRVPVDRIFWEEMEPYLQWRRENAPDHKLFLVHREGQNVSGYRTESVSDAVRDLGRSLGIKVSPHTLRRTFGREMYLAGCPLPELSRIMGHSSVETTLQYIGIREADLIRAMQYRPRYQII